MNRATKFLAILIVGLLLMMFGAQIFIYLLYIPYSIKTGVSFEEYYIIIVSVGNYFSNALVPNLDITYHEYAQMILSDYTKLGNGTLIFSTIQFLSYTPQILFFIFFLRKELKEDAILFKKDIKRNISIALMAFLSMLILGNIVGAIYGLLGVEGDSANENLINLLLSNRGSGFMILSVVLMAPFCEEIIFRKLLMGTCEEKFKFSPLVAILISSLVFSLIHVTDSVDSLKFIFQYLVLAIPMCVAYHLSGNNIYVTILVHFLNNGISVIGSLLM